MTDLDVIVLDEYKRLMELPASWSIYGLHERWRKLNEECTDEHPCIECQREQNCC